LARRRDRPNATISQPARPNRENREAARPERRRAIASERHRYSDAHHPWRIVNFRFTVDAADAVNARSLRGLRVEVAWTQVRGQQLPDVPLRLLAAREKTPVPVHDIDNRAVGHGDAANRILEGPQVHEEGQRGDNLFHVVADRIREHHIASAGRPDIQR
jgi:hypothetical protein